MVTLLSAGWLELPIVSYFSLHELNPLSCVLFPLGRYCESRIGISWNNSPAQVCWRTQRGLLLSGSYVLQLFSLFDRQPRLNIIRFLVGHVVYGGPNRVAYSNELGQKFQVKGDIFFASYLPVYLMLLPIETRREKCLERQIRFFHPCSSPYFIIDFRIRKRSNRCAALHGYHLHIQNCICRICKC